MRAHDWSSTPLGPPEGWPASLKTAVRIMLTSRQPIWVAWGSELIYLYNDAYLDIVRGKHPESFARPLREVWPEIWDEIEPMLTTAMSGDEGIYVEAQLLLMERNGYPEETYYTFSYSPIPEDASEGTRAGGLICANSDDTGRVIGQRQMALLRELAARSADARTWREACERSAAALATDPRDAMFATIYMPEGRHDDLVLAGACGIEPGHPAAPSRLRRDDPVWPVAKVLQSHEAELVGGIDVTFPTVPTGAWDRPPTQAAVLPIAPSGDSGRQGVLIVGLSPYRLYDDDYRGFLALAAGQIAASISSANAYEEERRRAESLAELDRAKTTFFSNVSHEFRTPLTLMLGPVEDLLDRPTVEVPAEEQRMLELVHSNGLRLQKLVNTLLEFSRIEAGRVEASYEPTDLAAFTAELASNFRSACERAGLRLVVDCPPLDEPVFVDRDMWEKIVLNLISNAFKFTFEGEIEVTLRARDGSAELIVRDTGAGIPPEETPKLFDRFHRVESTRGRSQEGSGIGLALVQELVRLHGGAIDADSEVGHGTTFRVSVPLGTEHLPADRLHAPRPATSTAATAAAFVQEALRWIPQSADAVPPSPVAAARGAGGRVLLADDNADMRDYVRRLLSDAYDVTAVGDGQSALDAALADPPDLILSDLMMPGLDGFELLERLRADPRTLELPVILLSARAGEEARVEGLEAGADDYLIKPFTARELVARVSTQIVLSRMRRESQEALRESEARFRNMADHAPVMIWVTDPHGVCTYLNQAWYRFTGTTPGQGLGFGWLDSVHPDDRAAARLVFEDATAGRTSFRLEYRLRRHDGVYCWAIDAAAPRLGAGGEFLGFIGSVVDISELKQVEHQLRDADRRKDEFLATLAHELRNPLAPIRSGLELLKLSRNDPAAIDRVHGIMERQTRQLVTIVDDLLDVSRITRGKLELRRCRVGLAEVVQSAVEASRPLLDEAGHELSIDLPDRAVWLDADPNRLAQVLSNLLNNAAKYTPEDGRIALSAELDGDEVVIAVADNGVGIPADRLDGIFEMFTQIDRPLERGYSGLGIGLTLVRSLVEMHGGRVEVSSEGPDRGTEFRVHLPVAEHAVASAREDAIVEVPAARRRVLVVDDNEDGADMLSAIVELLGNEVRTAGDGVEAIDVAADFRPDVVLMDIGMPRMNGYDAARHIRAQDWGRDLLLIALTGWGQAEDKQKTRDAGFDHHLVKPADPAQLEALLAEAPER